MIVMGKIGGYRDKRGCTFPGDYFHPKYMDDPKWDKYQKEIFECLELGMRPRPAFRAAGIPDVTYDSWRKHFIKDLEAGVRDSPLVKFMLRMAIKSEFHHKSLLKKANEIALDGEGNAKMIQYLLDTTHKYSKKQEVEVSTQEDTSFTINIIDSEPKKE